MMTARERQRITLLSVCLWLGMVLTGCGGNSGNTGTPARATTAQLRIHTTREAPSTQSIRQASVAPGTLRQVEPGDAGFVTRLRITIRAADIAAPIVADFPVGTTDQEQTTVELTVPVGQGRRITVEAFNTDDRLVFLGETATPIDIAGGTTVSVTIALRRGEPLPVPATPANLAQRSFILDNVQDFGIAPTLEATTLVVGTFDANTTAFVLIVGAAQAGGALTLGSCTFLVETSTFALALVHK